MEWCSSEWFLKKRPMPGSSPLAWLSAVSPCMPVYTRLLNSNGSDVPTNHKMSAHRSVFTTTRYAAGHTFAKWQSEIRWALSNFEWGQTRPSLFRQIAARLCRDRPLLVGPQMVMMDTLQVSSQDWSSANSAHCFWGLVMSLLAHILSHSLEPRSVHLWWFPRLIRALSRPYAASKPSHRLCALRWEFKGFRIVPVSDHFGYLGAPCKLSALHGNLGFIFIFYRVWYKLNKAVTDVKRAPFHPLRCLRYFRSSQLTSCWGVWVYSITP